MLASLAVTLARPLLLHPEGVGMFTEALRHFGGDPRDARGGPPEVNRFRGRPVRSDSGQPLYAVENGRAIITITGALVNRGAWTGERHGLTSYEGIAAQLAAALADPSVSAIVLDLDTGGGEATGAFEAAARVRAASGRKPVTAFVNGMAASAGYALACAAERVILSPSSSVGSIGVLLVHFDRSRQMDRAGLRPTLIVAGARKADRSPLQPLAPAARADLQAEVDRFHTLFVDTVAAYRKMPAAAVRATEAAMFFGAAAIAVRLADGVGTIDDALTASAAVAGPASPARPPFLNRPTTMPVHATTPPISSTKAPADPARVAAIKSCPEALGRESAAAHLADQTSLPVAEARRLLAASASDQAAIDASWGEVITSLNTSSGLGMPRRALGSSGSSGRR